MHYLTQHIVSLHQLKMLFLSHLPEGGIFHPADVKAFKLGDRVLLHLTFQMLERSLRISGEVVSKRPNTDPAKKMEAGVGIAFHRSERLKKDFLLRLMGGTVSEPDLRKSVRVKMSVPIHFMCSNTRFEGELKDLSKGGALVFSSQEVSENSTLELIIPLPDLEPVHIHSRIVRKIRHLNYFEYGLSFLIAKPDQLKQLFCVHLLKSMKPPRVESPSS
jgi:Tfp pilus assembly protein PilZ